MMNTLIILLVDAKTLIIFVQNLMSLELLNTSMVFWRCHHL